MLAHFFIAPQKRRVQPERYVPFFCPAFIVARAILGAGID
jgi:hypothetical protein